MVQSGLRIYHGPIDETACVEVDRKDQLTLPMGDVLTLLADAIDNNRTWLRDFKDDEITISTDLYEVLLAYQHYRRPVA